MTRAALTLGSLLVLASCVERIEPPPALPQLAAPSLGAVVQEALESAVELGLPEPSSEDLRDVADLLDLWNLGGPGSERAARALAQEDPAWLAAVLLGLSEDLATADELRRGAAAWLAARAPAMAIPRLTLRLKYEKDWVASAEIARGLLRLGSGAGIEALIAILREESREEEMYREARSHAAQALLALPAHAGWEPGVEFSADWERLIEAQMEWNRDRRLHGTDVSPPGPDEIAEVWRMIARLRSQPLRPVDDARFVLARAPADLAYAPLLAASRELDRYVRDHVLETISWIGTPLGRWADRQGIDAATALAELIGDRATRARAIEALGALGDPRAVSWLMVWLRGSPEECTAAADALLRCAGAESSAELLRASGCTPEAEFSLALLRRRLDPSLPEPSTEGVDPAEAARRLQWDAQRATSGR